MLSSSSESSSGGSVPAGGSPRGSSGGFPLGPGVGGSSFGGVGGFLGGSGSSSLIGDTASFGIISSIMYPSEILIGSSGEFLLGGSDTVFIGIFLSSHGTSGASTVFPLSGPPVYIQFPFSVRLIGCPRWTYVFVYSK